jgi:hypothetical protein
MEAYTYDAHSFIEVLYIAHGSNLFDNAPFREWIYNYFKRNVEGLMESASVKAMILNGGDRAWAFCSILHSFWKTMMSDFAVAQEPRKRTTALEKYVFSFLSIILAPMMAVDNYFYQ